MTSAMLNEFREIAWLYVPAMVFAVVFCIWQFKEHELEVFSRAVNHFNRIFHRK